MYHRLPALIAPLALLAGCGAADCVTPPTIIEAIYGDALYEFNMGLVRDGLWTCTSQGAIRNALGADIGRRYSCSRCP